MQEKQLFEYAVLRVVPRVEREEFMNVGVVLFSKKQKFLQVKFNVDKERLKALYNNLDIAEIESYLQAFDKICKAEKGCSPIALLDAASRFRWLTATRSTVLQTSKVHPGFCNDLEAALQKLFEQLVL